MRSSARTNSLSATLLMGSLFIGSLLVACATISQSSANESAKPASRQTPTEWTATGVFAYRGGTITREQLTADGIPVWGFRRATVSLPNASTPAPHDFIEWSRVVSPEGWDRDIPRGAPAPTRLAPSASSEFCYFADSATGEVSLALYERQALENPIDEIETITLIEGTDADGSLGEGHVVHRASLARHVDIDGTALGVAPPLGSPYVGPLTTAPTPLAYMTVHPFGLPTVVTDMTGQFTIEGTAASNVVAHLAGPYFYICNDAGPNAQLIDLLGAGSPQTLLFNPTPTEFGSAEVAAFRMLGVSYSFLETLSPGFAPAQALVEATVNFNGSCFASFVPAFGMVFTRSGSGCPNSAYGNVVSHEYFHHIAHQLGGFTAPYDEAMADVFAAYVLDDPVIGPGFYGPLTNIRDLVGTAQFPNPTPQDPAAEGLPLSQAFWDLRLELIASIGPAGEDLADELWLGSVLISAGVIDGSIIIDLLLLDDDDNDLGNGTPHQAQILAAFAAHGFSPPPIAVSGLTCVAVENQLQLAWQLPSGTSFDTIQIHRDGLPIATLPGQVSSYNLPFPVVGDHFYSVVGVSAGVLGTPASCSVVVEAYATFLRGDMNGDGVHNLIDVIAILGYLLQAQNAPPCLDTVDCDDDGSLNIADPIFLANYMFLQLAPPPAPFTQPGLDPTPDSILCPIP